MSALLAALPFVSAPEPAVWALSFVSGPALLPGFISAPAPVDWAWPFTSAPPFMSAPLFVSACPDFAPGCSLTPSAAANPVLANNAMAATVAKSEFFISTSPLGDPSWPNSSVRLATLRVIIRSGFCGLSFWFQSEEPFTSALRNAYSYRREGDSVVNRIQNRHRFGGVCRQRCA